jgi:hypothetical protein
MTKRPEPATVALPCIARLPAGVAKGIEPETRAVVVARVEPPTRAYSIELVHQLTDMTDRSHEPSGLERAVKDAAQPEPAVEPPTTIWARPGHAAETILLASSAASSIEPGGRARPSQWTRWRLPRARAVTFGALALCAVVVVAACLWKLAQPVTHDRSRSREATFRADARPVPREQSGPAHAAPPSAQPKAAAARPAPASTSASAPRSRVASSPTARLRADKLQAVHLLAGGKYEEALAAYRRLVTELPHEPAYAAIVDILQRRLAERCRASTARGEPACE